jgi:phage terminase small subunit
MALTKKQELFINEYLKCFNATKAAKEAGYKETSARQHGSAGVAVVFIGGPSARPASPAG